uniref:Putative terminase n=1 Tax=viral metagenome TaxID=1070528 RepID=A0A6M3IST4_9ZZZZ
MHDAIRLSDALRKLDAADRRVGECARNFWRFSQYVRTEDIDEDGVVRLYPNPVEFPHVRRMNQWLFTANRGVLNKKSRGMFATTATLTYMLWECTRTFTDIDGRVWAGCVISKNEDDAKLLIRRVKDIYLRLPSWLRRPLEVDNSREIKIQGGGLIRGLHAKGEGPRQEGYSFGLMDELGFQENADRNWRALLARTKRVVGISTPNGSGNLWYDLVHGKVPGVDMFTLHYSDHPYRIPGTEVGDRWQQLKRAGMPLVDWLREYEGRFDVWSEEGWFTHDFHEGCVVERIDWDGKSLIDIGIDPGYNKAGAMISFENEFHQWALMKEFLGEYSLTQDYIGGIFEYCKAAYPRAIYRLAADPACAQRQTIKDTGGANTDYEVIARMAKDILRQNLYPQFNKIPKLFRRDGHRMMRMMFKTRADGKPGMIIDQHGCPIFLEAMRGGYRQPERSTPHQIELEEPNRTSNHVHIVDATRYPIMQFTKREAIPEYEKRRQAVQQPTVNYDESGYPRGVR